MGNSEAATPLKPTNASSALEQNSAHPYRDWTTMQAYYGAGVSMPPYFGSNVTQAHSPHPYMWAPPILMPPFGTPYSAIYQPGCSYAQPPDSNGGNAAVTSPPETIAGVVAETKSSAHNMRAAVAASNLLKENESGSGAEAPSDSQSEGLDSSGGSTKRNFRHANAALDNRSTQTFVRENGGGRSTAAGPHLPIHAHLDDREVKKEKRKQSNRESARRSRLRKQAETEELAQKVEALVAENQALRSEVGRLTKESANLKLENSALQAKLSNRSESTAIAASSITENLISRIHSSAADDRAAPPAVENPQTVAIS
ncbi:G-box binding factor 2 isoform X2 [Wolffia australiana]